MNATQLVGLVAFSAAALASGCALWRTRRAAWWGILVLQSAFAVEVLVGYRHVLLGAATGWLKSGGQYDGRRPLQHWLLIGLATLSVLVAALLWITLRKSGGRVRIAALLSAATAALFVSEVISLHTWDAALYQTEGPVMLIAWCWAITSAIVVWCALSERNGARQRP